MAKTFRDMVEEGRQAADAIISPEDAQKKLQSDPKTLLIDMREPTDRTGTTIAQALNIPLGMLPLKADTQLPEAFREAKLQDRNTPVITTCGAGGQAALGAKILKDMGFTNVSIMEGGCMAWKNAGLPVS
ncbi:MAG TPA: rhodanese-like domain-containing protein [Chloroflexota bacterium]|nr:rhodanese-like domain-containing protein [Chloroflexota bacterium]